MQSLSTELFWLTLTILMTSLFWVPYILNRMRENGIWNALHDPGGETQARSAWATRMMRAHTNAVENLVIFAPLVLALQMQGTATTLTANACAIFFFARAIHYITFTFGVPLLRVLAFLVGFACQIVLAFALLG